MKRTRCPDGYCAKADAARRLGISEKTLDHRRQSEPLLANVLHIGRRVLFPIRDVEAYFRFCQQRGYV